MLSGYLRAIIDLNRNYRRSLRTSRELQKAASDQSLLGRSAIYAEQARFELKKAHGYFEQAKVLMNAAQKAGILPRYQNHSGFKSRRRRPSGRAE